MVSCIDLGVSGERGIGDQGQAILRVLRYEESGQRCRGRCVSGGEGWGVPRVPETRAIPVSDRALSANQVLERYRKGLGAPECRSCEDASFPGTAVPPDPSHQTSRRRDPALYHWGREGEDLQGIVRLDISVVALEGSKEFLVDSRDKTRAQKEGQDQRRDRFLPLSQNELWACTEVQAHNSAYRQCPTLPQGLPSSTIGAEGLNFSVRNGKRCFPLAIITGKRISVNHQIGK